MALSEKQVERLIQIIQQYAVIYGGGISTKDARIREECEELVKSLNSMVKKTTKHIHTAVEKEKKNATQTSTETAHKVTRRAGIKTNTNSVISSPSKKLSRKRTSKKSRRKMQAIHLFDAYYNGKLPKYGGYIVSSNFLAESNYSIFELVGYDNVQEIRLESDSLIFKSAGCKLYTLIEPLNYPLKNVEPVQRQSGKSIPYRFSELYTLTTKKHETIYIGKKPIISYSSFTIIKPKKNDFAILFYNVPEVFKNIEEFLTTIYHDGVGIMKTDSLKAARITVQGIKNFNTWLDL